MEGMGYRHGITKSTPLLRNPGPLDQQYMQEQSQLDHNYGHSELYENQQLYSHPPAQVSRFNRMALSPPHPMMPAHHNHGQFPGHAPPPGSQMYRNLNEYHFLPPVQAQSFAPDTAPYMGFVQRVKTVLEERLTGEDMTHRAISGDYTYSRDEQVYDSGEHMHVVEEYAMSTVEPTEDAPPSPSTSPIIASIAMGMIEAPETPIVEIVATTPPTSPTVKRLTRDMIKEATDTTSEVDVVTSAASFDASIRQYNSGHSSNESTAKESSENQSNVVVEGEPCAGSPEDAERDDLERHDFEDDDSNVLEHLQSEALGEATTTSVIDFPADADNFSTRFSLPDEPASEIRQTVDTVQHSKSPSVGSFDYDVESPRLIPENERPVSLPHGREPFQPMRPSRGHTQTRSLPTVTELHHFSSLDAQVQPMYKPEGTNSTSEEVPGIATVFPNPEIQVKDLPIITTIVNPSSYSDSRYWATPSIIARGSYVPIVPRSGHTSVSSVDGRFNTQRESHPNLSPGISPPISVHRLSARFSASSKHDPTHSVAQESAPLIVDSRTSGVRQFQFPLPDLTEDSQEDGSTTNLKILGVRPPGFRASGPRGMRYDGRQSNRVSMQLQQPRSYLSKNGTNSGEMPTLNFSHSDLTARLNQALGLRSSKSLEEIKRSKRRGMVIPLERSASSSSIKDRERYRSFFMSSDEPEQDDQTTTELTERLQPNNELLLEINRLSIPSVNNLTLRLSELLPAFNAGHSETDLIKDDEAVRQTLEDIRELGSPERMASNATSLPTPLSASRLSSADIPHFGSLHLMKDLPPLPRDKSHQRLSLVSSPSTLPVAASFENRKDQIQRDVVELEAPVQMSHNNETHSGTPGKVAAERSSVRSLKTTPVDTQPWNSERSYPWSENMQAMDITLPTQNANGSPSTRPFVQTKGSCSTLNVTTNAGVEIARTMSPGLQAGVELVPTSEKPELEKPTPSKKGLLRSISRKIGLQSRVDKAGFPIDPIFLHQEERPVDPGDRYPTTGLTPPAGLNIEENGSFFSDDSSHSERVVSLRKRLIRRTHRPKPTHMRPFSPVTSRSDMHRDTSHWVANGGSVFGTDSNVAQDTTQTTQTTQPDVVILYERTPAGMSRIEFRAKRFLEKLRVLWFKSGEAFRGKSRRHPPSWYEASDIFPGTAR